MKKRFIFIKSVQYSFRANPFLFIFGIVCGLLHSLFYVLFTMLMQLFFDKIALNDNFKAIWSTFLFLGLVTLLREIFNGLHNFDGAVIREYTRKYNKRLVLRSIQNYKPIDFENPNVLDKINKAKEGIDSCFDFVDIFLDLFDFYIPYFIFLGVYLWSIYPQLLFLLILIFIPVLLNTLIRSRIFDDHEEKIAILRRRHEGFLKCFLNIDDFRESKGMGIFQFLNSKRDEVLKNYHAERKKVNIRATKIEIGMRVVTLIGYFCVICYLGVLLINSRISIGSFAALYTSIDIFFDMMQLAVYNNIGTAFQNLASVKNFLSFIDINKVQEESGKKKINMIELRQVGFSYDRGKKVLKDINLCLKRGDIMAIVGENGMGKSTLARILCGVYTPEEGNIYLNGLEVKRAEEISVNASALFQKFIRYKMSIAENVNFTELEDNHQLLMEVLSKAGMTFLEEELDDELGREFGGRDLSGGQWQRLALARCIYKDADIIVLDEPTSAIDPIEERRLYNKFIDIMQDKIGIIVTHRIGAARLADFIIVMDNGSIIERGTHEELMIKKGKYYKMFCTQAQGYKINK